MKGEQQPRILPLRTILTNFLNHVETLDRRDDDSYDKEFQVIVQRPNFSPFSWTHLTTFAPLESPGQLTKFAYYCRV